MRTVSQLLKERYNEKVYRLSLTSGCTCPNRDGTIGTGGCTFCSAAGSGEFAALIHSPEDVKKQMENAKKRIADKTDARKFIAYFQAFTNTYGDLAHLEALYRSVLEQPEIVILSLGTRPDCLGEEVMEMLKRLNQIKPVWIELGLQTIHEKTARRIRRGYPLEVFEDAAERLHSAGIEVIVHLILGLPSESREDMLESARYVAERASLISGLKIHMLNVLEGSKMGEEYRRNPFPLLDLETYTSITAEILNLMPDEIAIHRMSGDGPGDLLIAPDWVRNKKKVLNTIRRKQNADRAERAGAGMPGKNGK